MVGMQLTRWTTDAMFVDYSQYSLQGEDSSDYDEIQVVGRVHEGNGLVAACPEVLVVIAGTECGDVRLTTERRQDTPPPPGHAWEAAVDISMYSTSGQLWPRTAARERAVCRVHRRLARGPLRELTQV
jgi:hypothetical protein